MGLRAPILDGNVKRVLARYLAQDGYPGEPKVARALWEAAERFTPHARVNHYTQAMMDLGATLCTRAASPVACFARWSPAAARTCSAAKPTIRSPSRARRCRRSAR